MENEYIETPYGRFKLIEWDMRNRTDEFVELVAYCEPISDSDDNVDYDDESPCEGCPRADNMYDRCYCEEDNALCW